MVSDFWVDKVFTEVLKHTSHYAGLLEEEEEGWKKREEEEGEEEEEEKEQREGVRDQQKGKGKKKAQDPRFKPNQSLHECL